MRSPQGLAPAFSPRPDLVPSGRPRTGTRAPAYELTGDTHFVIAPHPDHDGRLWAHRRRLGPRLQARARAGRAHGGLAHGRRGP
jgi:hypothetical protein